MSDLPTSHAIKWSEILPTALGTVACSLFSSRPITIAAEHVPFISTGAFRIDVSSFELPMDWNDPLVCNGPLRIVSGRCWCFRISCSSDVPTNVRVRCALDNDAIMATGATGENLAAVEYRSADHWVHVGTEDDHRLAYRSSTEDGFPKRFLQDLILSSDLNDGLINLATDGLWFNIPELMAGEELYFQIIAASAVDEMSSWSAIDRSKKEVDRYRKTLGIP